MSDKLTPDHLRRAAYIYVRQSTPQQVRDHREGQDRQYALADRARALGFARVVVIDEDLGKSGTGLVDRPGFGHLLAAVCRGEAGAVVALEASRLARNNRDWRTSSSRGMADLPPLFRARPKPPGGRSGRVGKGLRRGRPRRDRRVYRRARRGKSVPPDWPAGLRAAGRVHIGARRGCKLSAGRNSGLAGGSRARDNSPAGQSGE
jgi:hypothetical protein